MATRRHFWFPLLFALSVLGGCDASLDPYTATSSHFSIFGYLDVTRTTHWVRIEALQDGVPVGADSTIDATATLTHLPSGREMTFTDSLFSYNEGLAHNFYARVDLQLGDAYRFVVRDSSGNTSTAEVTMPHAIPRLVLSEDGLTATIEGAENDRLLFLTVVYRTIVDPADERVDPYRQAFTFQYARQATRTDTGYVASFTWKEDVRSVLFKPSTVTLTAVRAEVGVVHPDAPLYGRISYEELFTPGAPPSNVENGFGYLAGIAPDEASVTIPEDDRPEVIITAQ